MVRVSKAKLMGVCISSVMTCVVLIGGGMALLSLGDPQVFNLGAALIAAGTVLPVLTFIVVLCILIHRMWAAIQFGDARMTPGKAVGLCFVPFFNLYWIFPAIRGWATDYNRIIATRQITAPRMSEGLALTLPLCMVLSLLPYCGIPVVLAVAVIAIIFIAKAANCINGLADALEQTTAPVTPQVAAVQTAPVAPAPVVTPVATPSPVAVAVPVPAVPVAAVPVAAAVVGRLSKMAVFSLILGILGFVTAGLGGLAGIILGFISWRRIRNPQRQLRGKGIAIAGILISFASLALTLLAVAGAAFYYYGVPRSTINNGASSQWVTALAAPAQAPTTFSGTVKAARTTVVKSAETGEVKKIVVTQGQSVKVGDPLIELDDTDAKTALDEAENAMKEAATARQEARKALSRARQLLKEGSGTRDDVQSATDASKQADDAYTEAKSTRDAAKETLNGMIVLAPMAGQVTEVIASEGDTIGPDDEAIRIADLTKLDAVFDLSKEFAQGLRIGQRRGLLIGDTGVTRSGVVRSIEADTDSDNCTVAFQIVEPQGIEVDTAVTVALSQGSTSVVLIPRSAVQHVANGDIVNVMTPSGPQPRVVTLGNPVDQMIEITSGIAAGEQVEVQQTP